MTRQETLDTAKKMVCGHREQEHGSPEDNFNRIASYWSTYKNVSFTATDVAMMMALLKIARISSGNATKDSFIDLAGYAACGAEIAFPEPTMVTQNFYSGKELVATISQEIDNRDCSEECPYNTPEKCTSPMPCVNGLQFKKKSKVDKDCYSCDCAAVSNNLEPCYSCVRNACGALHNIRRTDNYRPKKEGENK